jgi:hypothetical protein
MNKLILPENLENLDGESFLIQWGQHDLFGWEYEHSLIAVERLKRLIKDGVELPRVPLLTTDLKSFYLSPDFVTEKKTADGRVKKCLDGGHRRALAHYDLKLPLPCTIHYGVSSFCDRSFPIKNCFLDPSHKAYGKVCDFDTNYPLDFRVDSI